MKRRCRLLLLVLGCAQAAVADVDGEHVANFGNSQGAAACTACHGEMGEGDAKFGYPYLAGMSALYIEKQLSAYVDGTRVNLVMNAMAPTLTQDEIRAVAKYYASLPAVGASALVDKGASSERGKELAETGKWEVGVPACFSCHGANGLGVAPTFPPISGQPASYIANQISAFKEARRSNDRIELMRVIADRLDETDIEAVSNYLGSGSVAQGKAMSARTITEPIAVAEFLPPPEADIPDDAFGKMIRYGKAVFMETGKYAPEFTGNGLTCVNCHLDAGRLADSAPMWAAWGKYPAYRAKTKMVNTMEERIQGCFEYSMNGTAPPAGSDVLKSLMSYSFWMATGAPTNVDLPGGGYPAIEKPENAPDFTRGEQVFKENCALCHGENGDGTKAGAGYAFPPLWGSDSFNWGAGMHRINTAASFIWANMPLGKGGSLSIQDAWDVAYYMNSHDRPRDPRDSGDLKVADSEFHAHQCRYGDSVGEHTLGRGEVQ